MTEIERVNYLIDYLAGGNARRFADACGIRTDSLSRVRNGKSSAKYYFPRITMAFPDVRREWLDTGNGEPFKSAVRKGEISDKLDTLIAEMGEIKEMLTKALKKP